MKALWYECTGVSTLIDCSPRRVRGQKATIRGERIHGKFTGRQDDRISGRPEGVEQFEQASATPKLVSTEVGKIQAFNNTLVGVFAKDNS